MKNPIRPVSKQEQTNRRSFLKGSAAVASAATVGAGLLAKGLPAFAQNQQGNGLTAGDAAILRFFQALETIEADLWRQYAELGGATNQGISPIDLNDQNGNDGDERHAKAGCQPNGPRNPVSRTQGRKHDDRNGC